MSTAGRSAAESAPVASDIAARLRDAPFVRVVARADGASLAAGGLLARGLADAAVPYQVSVARPDAIADRIEADDGETVVVGAAHPDGGLALAESPSVVAYEAVRALGGAPDPVLALAGVVADERVAGDADSAAVLETALERGLVERRPGVAIPTADIADGLAHTTLTHAPFSGDLGAVQADLAELDLPVELDEAAHRTLASLVALETAGAAAATDRAAEAVVRALRPYALTDGPFATVGGYADVLDAVARDEPGTGVALALGHDVRAAALDAWREHAAAAHLALRGATTGRYDGLFVARLDEGPVETTARLLRDFRSPEPVALVVADDEVAAASADDRALGEAMATAADATDGRGGGSARRGYARIRAETKEFIAAFREAL